MLNSSFPELPPPPPVFNTALVIVVAASLLKYVIEVFTNIKQQKDGKYSVMGANCRFHVNNATFLTKLKIKDS